MTKVNLTKLKNPHLNPSNLYVGGMTRDEVLSKIGDKTLYKLSSNENLLGPSPKAIAAIQRCLENISEYPDRSDQRLRQALGTYYEGTLHQDHFITGNSGSEVLEFICRAFLQEGDEYIISNPCFKPYEMFSEKLGAVKVDVPLIESEDYRLDLEGVLNAVTPKTKLIFLTSPSNPTGTIIPRETMKALLDQLPDHVVVVYDEVYARYVDHEDYAEAAEFVHQGYPVIGLNSFSKLFGLAGLRLGYAYTTEEIATYVRSLYKPFHVNMLALEAGIAALSDLDFLQSTTDLIKKERPRIQEQLTALGILYYPSQSNFIMVRPEKDMDEITEALLQEGIMVRPVAGFGAPGCIRVTIGTAEANEAFLKAIEKVM